MSERTSNVICWAIAVVCLLSAFGLGCWVGWEQRDKFGSRYYYLYPPTKCK